MKILPNVNLVTIQNHPLQSYQRIGNPLYGTSFNYPSSRLTEGIKDIKTTQTYLASFDTEELDKANKLITDL